LVGIRRDIRNVKEYAFPKPIEKKSFLYDMISGVDFKGQVKTKFDPKELFGEKIPMGRNRFQKINELNDFFIFCDTRNGHTTIHSWDLIKTTAREKKICMVILRNRRKKIYGNSDGNPMNYDDLKELILDLEIKELEKLITKKILRMVDGRGYAFVNSKNSAGVNGIYRIYLPHSNIFSTLTATGTRDYVALKSITADSPAKYKEKFLEEIVRAKAFRKITAKEAGKLQGFPAHFTIHANEMIAKKQFGNAVSTSVVYHVAKELVATNVFEND
jgi:DNA (cytosine-5)-methyltransferase 1